MRLFLLVNLFPNSSPIPPPWQRPGLDEVGSGSVQGGHHGAHVGGPVGEAQQPRQCAATEHGIHTAEAQAGHLNAHTAQPHLPMEVLE